MASTAQYVATPNVGVAVISTANANRDGTGTLGTVWTAGASGGRVETVVIQAIGAVTDGMVRLFVHNGTTAYLLHEEKVAAVTPSATEKAWQSLIVMSMGLVLPTGWTLRAAPEKAESFNVIALGGNF